MTTEPSQSTPSPFLPGTKIQWAWDASSLSMLKRCPREYYYGQILGLRRKYKAAPATFGGAFAKALEVYEIARPKVGHGAALSDAMQAAAVASDGMEDHKSRTKEALFRSVAAYLNKHESDNLETVLKTDGEPAVELHFKVPLGKILADNASEAVLCGYMDRVVLFQENAYVLDNKTTGASISTEKGSEAYFKNFTPDNQVTAYAWAAREGFGIPVRGVIIDAMQVAKTKTEFARQIIHRTTKQVDEWRRGLNFWVRQATASAAAMESAKTEEDRIEAFPMNETSCHKYGGCSYRNICGKDPAVRQAFLDTDYEVREWNPLVPRTKGTIASQAEDGGEGDTDQ